jgi:hypothetical protein
VGASRPDHVPRRGDLRSPSGRQRPRTDTRHVVRRDGAVETCRSGDRRSPLRRMGPRVRIPRTTARVGERSQHSALARARSRRCASARPGTEAGNASRMAAVDMSGHSASVRWTLEDNAQRPSVCLAYRCACSLRMTIRFLPATAAISR